MLSRSGITVPAGGGGGVRPGRRIGGGLKLRSERSAGALGVLPECPIIVACRAGLLAGSSSGREPTSGVGIPAQPGASPPSAWTGTFHACDCDAAAGDGVTAELRTALAALAAWARSTRVGASENIFSQ